jgi:hypothetical protein
MPVGDVHQDFAGDKSTCYGIARKIHAGRYPKLRRLAAYRNASTELSDGK